MIKVQSLDIENQGITERSPKIQRHGRESMEIPSIPSIHEHVDDIPGHSPPAMCERSWFQLGEKLQNHPPWCFLKKTGAGSWVLKPSIFPHHLSSCSGRIYRKASDLLLEPMHLGDGSFGEVGFRWIFFWGCLLLLCVELPAKKAIDVCFLLIVGPFPEGGRFHKWH